MRQFRLPESDAELVAYVRGLSSEEYLNLVAGQFGAANAARIERAFQDDSNITPFTRLQRQFGWTGPRVSLRY